MTEPQLEAPAPITHDSQESVSARQQRYHRNVLVLVVGILLLATFLPMPQGGELRVFGFKTPDICPTKGTFNIDCPGCGLTRSFISMGHLKPARAFEFNRVGPLFFAFLALQLPYRLLALLKPSLSFRHKAWDWSVPGVFALLVLNWLYNLIT